MSMEGEWDLGISLDPGRGLHPYQIPHSWRTLSIFLV